MAPEFSIRSDSVDVEQIMKQIRARIREKRGVDYTEDEIRELAKVKLEKFLDPSRVRSDLLQHYRRTQQGGTISTLTPPPENYAFEDYHVYGSERGGSGQLIAKLRKLLNPILKLFINPNPIIHVLHRQSAINAHNEAQFERIERVRADLTALNYEVMHNLVLEMTRLGIEVKNLKMRIESLSGRLDFNERRARALENVVQYKPGTGPAAEQQAQPQPAPAQPAARARAQSQSQPQPQPQAQTQAPAAPAEGGSGQGGAVVKGEAQRNRRRRRRRARGGAGGAQQGGGPGDATQAVDGAPDAGDEGGPETLGAAPGPEREQSTLSFDDDRGDAAPDAGTPGDSNDQ